MDIELETITFHAEGSARLDGQVPAATLLRMLQHLLAALDHNAHAAARAAQGDIEWIVTDLRRGSFEVQISATPKNPTQALMVNQAVQRVVRQTNAIADGRSPNSHGTVQAAKELAQLADLARVDGIPIVELSSRRLSATVQPRGVPRAPRLLIDRSPSSIEGTIMGLTFAGTAPQFTLRHRLKGELLQCFFSERFEETIVNALKQRVLVTGLVTTRIDGIVRSITDIDSIFVFRDESELPTVDDIIGIDPELTEHLPSDVWVRRNRERT